MCGRYNTGYLDDVVCVDVPVNVFDLLDNLVYVPHLCVHGATGVCVCVCVCTRAEFVNVPLCHWMLARDK